ncbi:MAG: alpha/beta fold hydrolase [Thermoflexales bacterium]|nr:alpha/beta fold hydrolase [Thermoflexales bacterium]
MLLHRKLLLPTGWLHFLDGGATHGAPAVLFLHGWALSSALFSDSLACLSAHRHVIGLDWPGFNGSSASVANWQYEDYAQAIEAYVDQLGLAPYHLVGHSTGGAIAIVLATRCPDNVRSLTLIDSAGIPLKSFWRVLWRKLLEIPAQFVAMPNVRIHLKLASTALFNFVFRAANAYHCMQLPLYADISGYLPLVRVPTLAVWGENDCLVPLSMGQQLTSKIPGASLLVLPRAYHEWSALQPKVFARVVENFVTQH